MIGKLNLPANITFLIYLHGFMEKSIMSNLLHTLTLEV